MSTPPGTDKAALLLNSLPPILAAKVMELLGPDRSKRVRVRMLTIAEEGPAGSLEPLVQELEASIQQSVFSPEAPSSSQLALYRRAADQSEPVPVEQAAPATAKADSPPTDLGDLPAGVLAAALEGEQIHVVARILNSIPVELAAEVLQRLPPETRRGVPVCLTRQGAPNPVLLARLTQALLLKAKSLGSDTGSNDPAARYQKIANMIRSLEKTDRIDILTALQEQEPEAATRVKDLLYQFEDLLRIVDRSMQKMLSEIDSKTLATALKSASEAIKSKVLNNLSSRARQGIEEEIELLGNVSPSLMRQAQKSIVDVIQRLDQAGELQMDEG